MLRSSKHGDKRNLNVDLKTVEEETLADVLRRFYAEVKTNKRLPLSPSGMVGVRITQAPISRKLNTLTNPSFVLQIIWLIRKSNYFARHTMQN